MAGRKSRVKRVRGRVVKVANGKNGLIGWAITSNEPLLSMAKPAFRNKVMRSVWQDAGDFWINNFLPLRFSMYAETRLGYKRSNRKKKVKGKTVASIDGQRFTSREPLVHFGSLVRIALKSAHSIGRPKGATIRFSLAHKLSGSNSAVLKRVPATEIKAIADHTDKVFTALMADKLAESPKRKRRSKRAR